MGILIRFPQERCRWPDFVERPPAPVLAFPPPPEKDDRPWPEDWSEPLDIGADFP